MAGFGNYHDNGLIYNICFILYYICSCNLYFTIMRKKLFSVLKCYNGNKAKIVHSFKNLFHKNIYSYTLELFVKHISTV